jgi:erythromycin esterase
MEKAMPRPPEDKEEIARWVRQAAQPIQTADPEAPMDDLEPLLGWFGSAAVVGLGEAVRGIRSGRELYQLKHRFLRLLVERLGFRAIAIEDTPAAGGLLDEYILTGQGDAGAMLAAAWEPWRTEEFLSTLWWLRSFNAQHAADPVRLAGVDGAGQHALALNTLAFQAETGRRLVYWGGIGHVAVSAGATLPDRQTSDGWLLRQRLGPDYLAVGLTCHHSTGGDVLPAPPEHFVESILGGAGLEMLALDLRQDPQSLVVAGWLHGPATTRIIGPSYDSERDADFSMSNDSLRNWFDVLVHVRGITPARYLAT